MTGHYADDAAIHHHMMHAKGAGDWLQIFIRSLGIVGVAELFDKTWFMGLLLAIRYNARIVFFGSFAALFVHTVLAAAMGYAFARCISPQMLNWATAVIFFGFALLYAKDWYQADPDADAIEAGKEDAGGDIDMDLLCKEGTEQLASADDDDNDDDMELKGTQRTHTYSSSSSDGSGAAWKSNETLSVFGKSFMGVFIAEWGDRTQIAMIGQHAALPLIPVFAGSVVAFFFLTLSAVWAATLLSGQKLRERVVFGFSSICFAVFGVFALRDALAA